MAKVYDPLELLSTFNAQSRTFKRSVRLGRCVTRIRPEKMEQVASRSESAGTGNSSSMLFLFIARPNGERNSCLLCYFTEHLCWTKLGLLHNQVLLTRHW